MHTLRIEKPGLEILSKADTGVGYLPRAIEAQTTVRIRTETTSPFAQKRRPQVANVAIDG